jgi:transposase
MAKFNSEEKIQSVLRYEYGNESIKEIAKDIGVHHSVFSSWVRLYEHQGENAFIKSYTSYSTKFKMDVLNYMNEMGTSYRETAAIFNLPTHTMVLKWQLQFEQGGIAALESKKKGRPSLKKDTNKPETQKSRPDNETVEALQTKVERLEMEIAYLKKLNALVQMQEKLQTKPKRK